MKKTKLRKGENVAYRNNKNIPLLAWHDKCVVVNMLCTWSIYMSGEAGRGEGGAKHNCNLHEHGQSTE
jgi:hypothetical protein